MDNSNQEAKSKPLQSIKQTSTSLEITENSSENDSKQTRKKSQKSSLEPETTIAPTQPSSPSQAPSILVKTRRRRKREVPVRSVLLDRFLDAYQRHNWNGTEAMMEVSGTTSRHNAATMASKYLKHAEDLGMIAMEEKGYSFGKMIDVAIRKMEYDPTPAFWDRLMRIGGYEKFMSKEGVTKGTIAILEVQKNLISNYIDGDITDE